MLRELHIANLAVIEDARIELGPGLNVFTGQTGAGKSLVLGAFELLLGLGSAGDRLRSGAREGRVSGLFEIDTPETLVEIAAAVDLPDDEPLDGSEPLLLVRKFFPSGRSSVAVNGHPGTTAMLRRIGSLLVDVQAGGDSASSSSGGRGAGGGAGGGGLGRGGWRDLQALLQPAHQLDLLDAFADLLDLRRTRYRPLHDRIRDLDDRIAAVRAESDRDRQRLDHARYQADEIDAVAPEPGEFERLTARHRILRAGADLLREGESVRARLEEGEGDDALGPALHRARAALARLAGIDEAFAEPAGLLESAAASVDEAAVALGRRLARIEIDPGELAEGEARPDALNRLLSRFGPGTIEDVLARRQALGEEIERLDHADTDLRAAEQERARLEAERAEVAAELREKRTAAAARLEPLVQAELVDLAMPEAEFRVLVEPRDEPGPSGTDRIDLHIRTNPGSPARPLGKVASGGELSRVLLALKTILAAGDRTNVLVFDEIDARIGARLGDVLGRKLRTLADGHQVLCITHLPQIAAYADRHFRIAKRTDAAADATWTEVECLEDDESRIAELSDMLAGDAATSTTRQQARELLERGR